MLIIRRIRGGSMAPSLRTGQLILAVKKLKFGPGNVVIFEHKGLEKIKRIREHNEGKIFVIGDNPEVSTDSRQFGWLSETVVVARVIWPRL